MDEKALVSWFDGFTKVAAEHGITDPQEVQQLMKMTGELETQGQNPEAFDRAFEQKMAEAGIEKEALLGALALGAGLGLGGKWLWNKFKKWKDPYGLKLDPKQRTFSQVQDFQNMATKYRDQNRPFQGGAAGQTGYAGKWYPSAYGRSGYKSY